MADEASDGRLQDPREGAGPEGTSWPWSEAPDGDRAWPEMPASEVDATLSLPVEGQAVRVPRPLAPAAAAALAHAIARGPVAGEGEPRSGALGVSDAPRPPNEAIPAVPPEAGTGPVGSIPAAHARAVWSRVQASNWRLFLIRFLSAGLAVVVTVMIVPGLGFVGWRWGDFTRIAVIFGLLNATVKPLLQFLVLRFIFSTYGIVVVVINTLLLVLLAVSLSGTFEASRPVSVLFGGLLVGVLGLVFETLLGATPPTLDRDYKERNGLS